MAKKTTKNTAKKETVLVEEVENVIETTDTKVEEVETIEEATDVDKLEKQLKEENLGLADTVDVEPKADLSIEEEVDLLKEYSDINQKIEDIANTKPEDINGIVADELKKVAEIKESLENTLKNAEAELTPELKNVSKKMNSAAFSAFWNGVSFT